MSKPANKSVRSQRKQLSESPYLLGFNFICKSCGGPVIGRNGRYTCGTYDRKGKKACGAPLYSIKQQWIEEEAIKAVGLAHDENIVERVAGEIFRSYIPKANKSDIEALQKRIKENEKAKSNLLDILQSSNKDTVTIQSILSRIESLEKEITGCWNELAMITRPVAIPSKNQLKEKIKDIYSLFQRSNFEQKRNILQAFIKQLTLDPFSKSIIIEGYCDPLCTWTENTKLNKKAPDCSEAYDFTSVQVGCGGLHSPLLIEDIIYDIRHHAQ